MKKRLLLSFSSLVFVVTLSVVGDRLVGWFIWGPSQTQGLVFARNVSDSFQTPEFSFRVETNSLGFRDREFERHKTARTRVLALGDSFTYGWGVEVNQSWPKVLESQLLAAGCEAEIANLGKPAGSPRDYASIAERAIPVLNPDLLIVGVLQGDDLAQMGLPPQPDNNESQKPEQATRYPRLRAAMSWLYPTLLELLDERVKSEPLLADQWRRDAQTFETVMTPPEKARFERLDLKVKTAFRNGELNPALIYLSAYKPDYFTQTMDPNSPAVKSLVSEMGGQLLRIKNAAQRNHAEVIVVSVPYGIFVSQHSFESRQRLGFWTTPEMLKTTAEDEAIRSASQTAGVSFYDFTREFRQASVDRDFFFELDGHLNADGHRFFAQVVTPVILKRIAEMQRPHLCSTSGRLQWPSMCTLHLEMRGKWVMPR